MDLRSRIHVLPYCDHLRIDHDDHSAADPKHHEPDLQLSPLRECGTGLAADLY